MASLLERMQPTNSSAGPVRNRGGGRSVSVPYERPADSKRRKEEDVTVWRHDMYKGPGSDLSSRLAETSLRPLLVDASGPKSALRNALGFDGRRVGGPLSIRGASSASANVVQIDNLAKGTTAADVESIFKSCGVVLESYVQGPKNAELVSVRIKYKSSDDAQRAILEYDGKSADGHKLKVTTVGSASTRLGGRFGGTAVLGGTVDVLIDDDSREAGGSKMRSDQLLSDPRAQVLTMPPGVDPADYQARGGWRGRGRRGRGGSRGGRGRGSGNAMNVD